MTVLPFDPDPILFVTTALRRTPELDIHAHAIASELRVPYVPRDDLGISRLFEAHPNFRRALIVQADRLLLVQQTGEEIFFHPNMAFLRLGNLLRGGRDYLAESTQLKPGDSVLDATLGYAAEATLCAHFVGDSGEVHGIEAIPELGVIVREGLQTIVTDQAMLNAAMRRVKVVHLGHHLDFLRTCETNRYDVVCFDPFFEEMLEQSQAMAPLRVFGSQAPLLPETIEEAKRVARRRVVIKTDRRTELDTDMGITARYGSRSGKVGYCVIDTK